MARRTVLLSGLTGNGSNGKMSIVPPLGLKYYGFFIEDDGSGTIAIANLLNVRWFANNDLKYDISGTDMDEINQFDGLAAFAPGGTLRIPFEMLNNMKSIVTQYSTAFNTFVPSPTTKKIISSTRLELVFSGATNPSINIYADVDDSTAEGPGSVPKIETFTDTLIGGKESSTTKLPYGDDQHQYWRRVFVKSTGGATCSLVRILWGKGNEERWNRTTNVNNQILGDNGKVPGTYFETMTDFTEMGVGELWDTTDFKTGDGNIQFKTTWSGNDTGTYYVFSIGSL